MSKKKPTFQHSGHYVCECGREFDKAQSYNAHLSHCRVHLGDERYENQYRNRQIKGYKIANDQRHAEYVERELKEKLEWESTDHFCETCGKKLTEKYASGRFCCLECAKIYSTKNKLTLDKLELEQLPITTSAVKRFLLDNNYKENKCEICGITEWQGKPIVCQLHHKDGNRKNNKLSNLQMLCPNCHSQTDNYSKKLK